MLFSFACPHTRDFFFFFQNFAFFFSFFAFDIQPVVGLLAWLLCGSVAGKGWNLTSVSGGVETECAFSCGF